MALNLTQTKHKRVANPLYKIHFQTRHYLDQQARSAHRSFVGAKLSESEACAYIINSVRTHVQGLVLQKARNAEIETDRVLDDAIDRYIDGFANPKLSVERIHFPKPNAYDTKIVAQLTGIFDCLEIINRDNLDAPREILSNLCQPIAMLQINPVGLAADETRQLIGDLIIFFNWLLEKELSTSLPGTTVNPTERFEPVYRQAINHYLSRWTDDALSDASDAFDAIANQNNLLTTVLPSVTILRGVTDILLGNVTQGYLTLMAGISHLNQNQTTPITFWTDYPPAFRSTQSETYYDIARLKVIVSDHFKLKVDQIKLKNRSVPAQLPDETRFIPPLSSDWCDRVWKRLSTSTNFIAHTYNLSELLEISFKKLGQIEPLLRYYDSLPLTAEVIKKKAAIVQILSAPFFGRNKIYPTYENAMADQFLNSGDTSFRKNLTISAVLQAGIGHIHSDSILRSRSLEMIAAYYLFSHQSGTPILPETETARGGILLGPCHHALAQTERLTSIYTALANRVLSSPITPCPCCGTERRYMHVPAELRVLFNHQLDGHISGMRPIDPDAVGVVLLTGNVYARLMQGTLHGTHLHLYERLVDLGYRLSASNEYAELPWLRLRYFGPNPRNTFKPVIDVLNQRFGEICSENGDPSLLIREIQPHQFDFFWRIILSDANQAVGLIQIQAFDPELANLILQRWDPQR